jgi:hypothetical protein
MVKKKSFKEVLCIALALCIMVSLVIPLGNFVSASGGSYKMLSVSKTSTARGEMKASILVEKGKTYYYTFGLTNTITTNDFELVCRVNTGTGTQPGVSANIQQVDKQDNGKSTIYTYSYTIPENDSNIGNNELFFIIRFKTACQGYFFNPVVYESTDSAKTQLLRNADFSQGLYGWIWEFKSFASGTMEANVTEYEVNLKVVDADFSL